MKIFITIYSLIIVLELSISYASKDYCQRPNFQSSDDTYINKDIDMCTMFMQSYPDSMDMKMSVKDFLLKHLSYSYLYDGHLHSFTEYQNNYTFLLASTIDKIEEQNQDQNKNKYNIKVNNLSEDGHDDDKNNQFKYESIDWNRSPTEVLDDIIKNFQIIDECNSVITFYLTFPSYPEEKILLNFLQNFENNLNKGSYSFSLNDNPDLHYRQDINPSFTSFVDALPLIIFQQLLQQYSNVRLVLCGHGLGGTIAQLSTLHLLSKGVQFHHIQLRSISIGSLFFAKESTINLIENHHLEKHFINIYHEMDPIPSLFNIAELLSNLIHTSEQEQKSWWDIIKPYLPRNDNPIEKHRFYLKHVLTWLCPTLTNIYSTLSPQICDSVIIDTTLEYLKKSFDYLQHFSHEKSLPKLIYQPIGIYNMVIFITYDRTWHLINVNNPLALNEHLKNTLQHLTKAEQIFDKHSIKTYITDLQHCNKQTSDLTKTQTISSLISSFTSNEDHQVDTTSLAHNNSNYSIIISLPFRPGKSYMNMISIPPVYPSDTSTSFSSPFNNLKTKLLSAIKHRTDFSQINLGNKKENKKLNRVNLPNIYDILLDVYQTYGMDARMELMKLQLDQRMLVPILVSKEKNVHPPFRSYIKTLSLVETPVLQPQENLLAFDFKFLRIGLISTIQRNTGGLPNLIYHIFHTLSLRQPISGTGSGISARTVVETGYGFLPDSKSPLSYQPVILMHIIGDYHPLVSFIAQYVDTLIVEYNEDDKSFANFDYNPLFSLLRIPRIMKWKHTIDAEFDEITHVEEPHPVDEFEGSEKAVTVAFQEHLLEMSHLNSFRDLLIPSRPRLVDIIEDKELFLDDDIPMIDMKISFQDIITSYVKKDLFQLQQSYKKEADNQLEIDNPMLQLQDDRRKQLEENIRQQRKFRSQIQESITVIPLLKFYISLAAEPNAEKRYIQKRQFEFTLLEFNEKTVSILRKNKDGTYNDMIQANSDVIKTEKDNPVYSSLLTKQRTTIDKHYAAKQEFISKSLVIDHFWREISHLFVTNKSLYSIYPDLAAQHMLDGFSLELLDGDSMLLNMQWLEAVFDSLNKKLYLELDRAARILVLSISGPQSSGKSFLLKTMYGIRIRSSVGACTQGVNMMLIKVYQQEYDYIFLLDTEGIRAPEFMNLPGAEMRDNTLATFAILPADGTILLNKGEINQALEDVLPTVLYLYATSSLAMQLGGQIPSKLFFVYNQIDTSQPEKGKELLQDLITRLHNVTDRIRQSISLENTSFHGFEQCRLDLKNLSNSDFRILTINTNNPPINHPVYLFGQQALQLRQWIDQRIANLTEIRPWKARTISDIFEYFKIVSDTIRQSPHITSVSSALEMFAYNKLTEQIEKIKYYVSANFTIIRTEIENEIIQKYTMNSSASMTILSSNEIENIINEAHERVLLRMNDTIAKAQQTIYELIKGNKRQASLNQEWILFLKEKKSRNRNFLAVRIDREITNAFFIQKVENKIQQDFIDTCNQINCTDLTSAQQLDIFNATLGNRTKEFQEPYLSGEVNVSNEIKGVYNRSIIIENVKIFDDRRFCEKNGSFQRISHEENDLKYLKNDESNQERSSRRNRYAQESQKFHAAVDQIQSFINILIADSQKYDSFIVTEVLQSIDQIIHQRSIISHDTIQDIHRAIFCFLEYQLIQLQNKWDLQHNRTKRLEDNRENLWEFFQNVVKGIRGIKLFQFDLYQRIQSTWNAAFIDNLIRNVQTDVAKQSWIGNSDVLSAYVDNEKIQILESKGIDDLLKETSSTSLFYEKCMNKFVQVHVNKYATNKWKTFYDNIIKAIRNAGNEAKNSPKDCLNVFLKTLRDDTLPWLMKSHLPSTSETYGNVDDQPRNIFDGVVNYLISAIPETPASKLKEDESQKILDAIRQDASTDAAKPACNHACRICGAPCFKHSNHSGHHNFYHQPAGLAGLRTHHTDFIVHESCYENFIRNISFSVDKGHSWHPFTEFPNIFGYEVPSAQSRRSRLGEYLMSKYHYEIAKYYGIKPNPPVPVAYEQYTLEDIKASIKKLMRPIG